MHAHDHGDSPWPTPLEDGQIPQVIVEYTGSRGGNTIRRGASGRQYQFGANRWCRRQYVRMDDVATFESKRDLRVLWGTEMDPAKEQLERLVDKAVEDRIAELLPPRRPRRPGGRPPVPIEENQGIWHLRNHCLPRWSTDQLAAEFLGDEYAAPQATIRTRLYRFKKDYPDLIVEERCAWCDRNYCPSPS